MRLLLIHQNFPGQFGHLARVLMKRGHEVLGLGQRAQSLTPDGITCGLYAVRSPGESFSGMDTELEYSLRRAHQVRQASLGLRQQGWIPDAVLFHCSWGEGLYLRDAWPDQHLVAYPELYGSPWVMGFGMDPHLDAPTLELLTAMHNQNLLALSGIAHADAIVVPTQHQRDSFPARLRSSFEVIHEGIDIEDLTPHPNRCLVLNQDLAIRHGDPVVTFCARHLEPLRGLQPFFRAISMLQKQHSSVRVLVVGSNSKGYGAASTHPDGHLGAILEELQGQLDLERIHFLKTIPLEQLKAVFQVSAAHVNLTYPYTLSWSVLQAMACESPIVGSTGAPVDEVISHRENGLLVDFHDPQQLCSAMLELLEDQPLRQRLGAAGRGTVERDYALETCTDRYEQLLWERH